MLNACAGLLEWQKDDLQAIAIILLEAIFSALAEGGPSQATSADALKRLLVEVFAGDIDRFRYPPTFAGKRSYCTECN